MVKYYEKHDIGKLIWACGLGKTFESLLFVKKQNYKSVVIGVPSTILQKQWKNEILKMFPNKKNILFVGGEGTTTPEIIKSFIKKSSDPCKFIITTYHSCHLLTNDKFDIKIGDEAHHLVGIQKEDKKNEAF